MGTVGGFSIQAWFAAASWYQNSPTFESATNFAVSGLLVFLSSLLLNFLVRMIFPSDSPNGQIKDPMGRKRGCALSAGAPPPPNKSAGAAARVVGVVGPTVLGRPQTVAGPLHHHLQRPRGCRHRFGDGAGFPTLAGGARNHHPSRQVGVVNPNTVIHFFCQRLSKATGRGTG